MVSLPKEFARKPRALREIDRWKATEFRQFLLYTGPAALINKLHQDVYKNFLLLHVGIFILVNPYLCSLYCDYAHDLLVLFVHHFGELCGRDMLVYNVHLANDVRKFGSLDNVSSFPFENFLHSLKKMVRKPTCPLPQIVKRMSELKGQELRRRSTVRKIGEFSHCRQYKEVHFDKTLVTTAMGNSCVKMKGEIVLVCNILFGYQQDSVFIAVKKFNCVDDFYAYPCVLSCLGVHQVSNLSRRMTVLPMNLFEMKCMILPCGDEKYVVYPLYLI